MLYGRNQHNIVKQLSLKLKKKLKNYCENLEQCKKNKR